MVLDFVHFRLKVVKKFDKNIVILMIFMMKIKKVITTLESKIIEVQNIKVNTANINNNDYICISDFAKFKDGKSVSDAIKNYILPDDVM